MLATYSALLRRPGTLRFSLAAFVARLPLSMFGLGVVLFVTLRGGSYALAGGLSAVGALSNAVVSPFLSRYVDRFGQSRVLPGVVSVAVVFQVGFVLLVVQGAPAWTWFLSLAVGEGLVPNIGSLVRARWAHVLDDAGDVRTAFALESVVDEVIFVLGPLLATILAVSVVGWGAVGAAIVLLALGTAMLVPLRATEPPAAGPEHRAGRAAVRYPGVPVVAAVFLLLGGVFGAFEVVTVAFAAEHDVRSWTGLLLAVYAFGSGTAGLVLGALHLPTPLPRQFRVALLALAVVGLPFPLLASPVALGAMCLVAGLAVAPSLISGFALVERLVPSQRLTEGLTVAMAGLTVGFAVGASVSGPVIDAYGASHAYLVLTGCALAAACVGLLGGRGLEGALAASHSVESGPRGPLGTPAGQG